MFALVLTLALTQSPEVENGRTDLSPGDWAGIQQAYAAGRHAVEPAADGAGHTAWNPGQRWRTAFDGRGFTTEPEQGGWSWGLELVSYGFAGQEVRVERPDRVGIEGQRLAYGWDENLEEWYVNDSRGLEHGFTVHRRPDAARGPLTFSLAVRGDLRPELMAHGRDVAFVDASGATVLTYAGLVVYDAEGDELPARFTRDAGRLRLSVNEHGAAYPLTIDPVAQQAYLKASNTDADDEFGFSVAVSGDTVVVGAPGESSNATGVDGNQADNSAPDAGAAYVFVRSGSSWSQQAYLKASNTEPVLGFDRFGAGVAISGDTIVVGADNEYGAATGVNGDETDNSAPFAGAAYVFVRSGTTWSQEAYLKASNTERDDTFGRDVAISGDTVVIGAIGEDSDATGVNGDEADNSAAFAGAVYVFTRSGTTWSQQAYLKASNTDVNDNFGYSLAISGDTLVAAARREASDATGVNGDESDNSANLAGAVYVFVRSGTTWSQEAYLKASNTEAGDVFGESVGISGDTVVVGAQGEYSNATGVDGDQADNSAVVAGAAYVFVRSGSTWSQQAYLKASNTAQGDLFGTSVAVTGDTVAVAAVGEDSSATGVNGDESDNAAAASGAVYVFTRSGTTWSPEAYAKASNTGANDEFGRALAADGDTIVVGAYHESSNATGVDGNSSDDSLSDAGAAYVFTSSSGTSFANQVLPAELVSDPALADSGGDGGIGPAINDASEPFALSLDCSGMATTGLYVFVLRTGNLAMPASSGFGDIWISGQNLIKSSGAHAQNVVGFGPVTLANDPSLVGIEYTCQAFCSQSPNGSRVSNGLVQRIGQ